MDEPALWYRIRRQYGYVWPQSRSLCTLNHYRGKLYLLGGNGYGSTFFEYNIDTSKWNPLVNQSNAKFQGHKALVYNHYLVVFGGNTTSYGYNVNNIYTYNFNNKKWKERGTRNPPKSRSHHDMCIINDKLIMYAGLENLTQTILNDMHWIDIKDLIQHKKPKWHKIETELPPLYGHTMISYQHKIYIFGGKSKNVIRYNPREIKKSVNGNLITFFNTETNITSIEALLKPFTNIILPLLVMDLISKYFGNISYIKKYSCKQRYNHNGCLTIINNQPYLFIFGGNGVWDEFPKKTFLVKLP